jgi:putative nucleotidyltransferase-like protein
MYGLTAKDRVHVDDGMISPSAGLPGLFAAPFPQDKALQRELGDLPRRGLPRLLDVIAYHRLEGLAHRAVGRLPQDSIDPWLRSSLKRRSQRLAAATVSQALALAEVLENLARRSIPVAVMRGLRMVESIYGDRSLRPIEYHDLLVLSEDREQAGTALLRLGYLEQGWGVFRRGGAVVGLHVDPLGAHRRPSRQSVFPVHVRSLFCRATPGFVAGGPSLLLEPEDELLLLAIHLVRHSFDKLVLLADVAHFVHQKRSDLDWDLLLHRARSCGVSRILGWTLRATTLLGVAVRAVDIPCAEDDGPLERFLMSRVLAMRPLPHTGEALMTLAAPTLRLRLLSLIQAFWLECERPVGARPSTTDLPRRVPDLAMRRASRAAVRRRT